MSSKKEKYGLGRRNNVTTPGIWGNRTIVRNQVMCFRAQEDKIKQAKFHMAYILRLCTKEFGVIPPGIGPLRYFRHGKDMSAFPVRTITVPLV